MSRISTRAANNLLLNQTLRTQSRLLDGQVQVASEKKTTVYSGIHLDTRRLLNLETTQAALEQYISNNEQMNMRLTVSELSIANIDKTMTDFLTDINEYHTDAVIDQERTDEIQASAFRALLTVQDMLNTDIDGSYLFAGGRATTKPVDIGFTTLSDFQAYYDGAHITYPTTRDAHLDQLSVDQNETTGSNSWLAFEERNATSGLSRITATSGEFANLTVGSTITVANTGGVNDGVYTIAALTSTTIDLVTDQFASAKSSAGTVTYQDPDTLSNSIAVVNAGLTFVNNDGTTADTLSYTNNDLDALQVGKIFTVSGSSNADNNKTFTVSAIDTTTNTISITPKRLTDQGVTPAPSFTTTADMSFANTNPDTIVAAAATFQDALGNNLTAGTQLTLTGTASNNITVTIASVSGDGSTATLIIGDALTVEGPVSTTATSVPTPVPYYSTTTNMTFADADPASDTITAAAGTFQDAAGNNLVAGVQLTLTGTASNNITVTIASVSTDGSTATLVSTDALTDEGPVSTTAASFLAAGSVSASSYYSGDQLTSTHQVDKTREFTLELNAAGAPFEKAIRALGVIAQGDFQTAGGLDQNTGRLTQVIDLITGTLTRITGNDSPFGTTEIAGNLEQVEIDLGFQQVLINRTNERNLGLISFFKEQIGDIENIDLTEAVTKLLDDQVALEASFAAFAKIRQLSLTNYL